MSLSKLPSEVLTSLLNNRAMPLPHRLRLRLLSNRWCDIIEEGLKKKSSLVLRDHSDDWYRKLKPNHLVLKSDILTQEHLPLLARLFTGLTQLTLILGQWSNTLASWSAVPALLTQLNTTNLTTVKLYGYDIYSPVKPLADALNALPSLTMFHLNVTGIDTHLWPLLGPILGRLEAFSFPNVYDAPALVSSPLSSKCTHLLLDYRLFRNFYKVFLTKLSRNLRHLHLVHYSNDNNRQLSQLFQLYQLHTLISLTIQFTYNTAFTSSLFRKLAPFPLLTDAKLYNLTYRTPLAFPLKQSHALPSIKYLTLDVSFPDTLNVNYPAFFRAISAWFPSLERLNLLCDPLAVQSTIKASLGELSFTVNILDYDEHDPLSPSW